MSFVGLYAIFALTTSIVSLYELVAPVIALRKSQGLPTLPVHLLYLVTFLLNIVAAPLVFFSCIVPSFGDRFRKTFYNALYSED